MSIFTPEDLILFAYQETSSSETTSIKDALASDWALQQKYNVIESSVSQLDTELQTPRAEVVLRVLNYARETMQVPTE
jgi:hypothetical protein